MIPQFTQMKIRRNVMLKVHQSLSVRSKLQCVFSISLFLSFLNKDSTSVSRSQLEPVKPVVEYLEGEEDVWIIGEPIFESSVCQPSAAEEQRSCLSSCWAYTVDTSYETTLPLQVQVSCFSCLVKSVGCLGTAKYCRCFDSDSLFFRLMKACGVSLRLFTGSKESGQMNIAHTVKTMDKNVRSTNVFSSLLCQKVESGSLFPNFP